MTSAQQNPEESGKQELSPIPEQGKPGALALPASAEQMQEVADRLASVQEMLKKLPGTIGAAVADALLHGRPKNASGPPVPMAQIPADIEFGKGQAMKGGGKVITEGVAIPVSRKPLSRKEGTRPLKR